MDVKPELEIATTCNEISDTFIQHVQHRRAELQQLLLTVPFRNPVVLEIGCGHGHFLTAFAEKHPDQFCVGVDRIRKRLEKADQKKEKRLLPNIRFIRADAVEFLECLPEGVGFHRFFVLFADPWPKNRHWKNRLLQSSHLDLLASKSLPGAFLHFRTDDQKYFSWVQQNIRKHSAWKLAPDVPWPFERKTVFQSYATEYQSLTAVVEPTVV